MFFLSFSFFLYFFCSFSFFLRSFLSVFLSFSIFVPFFHFLFSFSFFLSFIFPFFFFLILSLSILLYFYLSFFFCLSFTFFVLSFSFVFLSFFLSVFLSVFLLFFFFSFFRSFLFQLPSLFSFFLSFFLSFSPCSLSPFSLHHLSFSFPSLPLFKHLSFYITSRSVSIFLSLALPSILLIFLHLFFFCHSLLHVVFLYYFLSHHIFFLSYCLSYTHTHNLSLSLLVFLPRCSLFSMNISFLSSFLTLIFFCFHSFKHRLISPHSLSLLSSKVSLFNVFSVVLLFIWFPHRLPTVPSYPLERRFSSF
ncbi:unnamed protein product [Acanthosepion pharaonis]|uniref:Uncharacterized protein n=1 Tax=Acanthosepion pharaonis TaxID=158019 RepID=A0A812C604_ACAPH|nr:unnamed protein product [Sepia pharaonis]